MSLQPKIYVDLDDVLNTFTPSLFNALGAKHVRDYDTLIAAAGEAVYSFDVVAQARALFKDRQYTVGSLWAAVTREIWAGIPKSDQCDSLLELCRRLVGPENVMVLTAPVLGNHACYAGKLDWAVKNLPSWAQQNFTLSKAKHLVAGECKLLIDDSTANIDAWLSQGGSPLLWPRPWNFAKSQSMSDIQQRLERWERYAYSKSTELHVA